MKTIKQVSELTDIGIKALRHYDKIGLVKASALSDAGYRLYDDDAIARLWLVRIGRDMGMPLEQIKAMINGTADRTQALLAWKAQLEQERRRLDGLIDWIDSTLRQGADLEPLAEADIIRIVDHALASLPPELRAHLQDQYSDADAFRNAAIQSMLASRGHYMRMLGGREQVMTAAHEPPTPETLKTENDRIYRLFGEARRTGGSPLDAVAQLAEHYQHAFHIASARNLLLQMADTYLEARHPELLAAADAAYGVGICDYIGHAIRQYYGMEKACCH